MTFICPHCNHKSVSHFSKFLSFEGSPATCSNCGKHSIDANGVNDSYRQIVSFGLIVFGALSLFTQTILYFAIWFAFTTIFPIYSLYCVPLEPIETEKVKRYRSKKLVSIGVFSVLVLLVVIFE
ncbi:hypothetical protein [Pseudoalteromonas obscura]|uniref:Uncharacterized protein n=1 Tax=Pseudoalteromonas obscura TaxID=3048491 RepID=A0ABT7EPH8_9GAMM|nr:hypothetical protein [Pseudoalteromonas sp. P94(2023)]MDK2596908.1 hypothetical protein [Pseudoalteromonas sp. P94(2023)]